MAYTQAQMDQITRLARGAMVQAGTATPTMIQDYNKQGGLQSATPKVPSPATTQNAPTPASSSSNSSSVSNSSGFQQTGSFGYTPQGYEAATSKAQNYAAQGLTVTPDMLVNEQVANLMQSPVGQMAMDVAREQMNSRGMMNSTAAMNAITMAAIKAGIPIAQQDAATYLTAAQESMAAENAARQANAAQQNTMSSLNANAQNAARAFNAGAANTASQSNAQNRLQYKMNQENIASNDRANAQRAASDAANHALQLQQLAENRRQFDATNDLNKLRTHLDALDSRFDRANAAAAWVQSIASAGLNRDDVRKITTTLSSLGLWDPSFAQIMYDNMPDSMVETGAVV